MKKYKIISKKNNIRDAIQCIEESSTRTVIVVGEKNFFYGLITDGDIRKFLLSGGNLSENVEKIMNISPIYCRPDTNEESIIEILNRGNIQAIPILSSSGNFIDIIDRSDFMNFSPSLLKVNNKDQFDMAVILAGGEGQRLRPLTNKIPKPMISIDGIPVIEKTVRFLVESGIRDIKISINYLGHIIRDYFQDGSKFGATISYIEELDKLGTAGPLSLIKKTKKSKDILLINGDVLTNFSVQSLYSFHQSSESLITVAASIYHVNIPYGVINLEDNKLKEIIEKPSYEYLCNAGIYALKSKVLDDMKEGIKIDMPEIIQKYKDVNTVSVFPIFEYWSDIGTFDELEKTKIDIKNKKI